MKKSKAMAIFGLIFIIVGTILTAMATMKYRSDSENQRKKIDSLTQANNDIGLRNEELNKKIETTSFKNLGLSEKNNELNKVLDIKSDENKKLIQSNIEIANKNSSLAETNNELAKKVNELGEKIYDKTAKLQRPITEYFEIYYTLEFDDPKLVNRISKLSSDERIFFPLDFKNTSDYELFEGYNEIKNILKNKFIRHSMLIKFIKNEKSLWLGGHYNFDTKIINEKLDIENSNKLVKLSVIYNRGQNKLNFSVSNLPLTIILKSGNLNSLLDLKESDFLIFNGSSLKNINKIKLTSIRVDHQKEAIFVGNKFKFDENKHHYVVTNPNFIMD